MNNSLKHIIECFAIIPLIIIGLGGVYYYSFYEALGLGWIFSQGSISTILLSSIPLFFKAITGLILACTIHFIFFKNLEYFFGCLIILGSFLGVMLGSLVFLGFSLDNFFLILYSYSVIIFTFISSIILFMALDAVGNDRFLFFGILAFLLIFIEPLVTSQGQDKAEQLLSGSGKFSKVSFTSEGLKTIPTTLEVTKNNKKYDEDIDWRILDMIGDKVIIIALNHSQNINGKKKQLVRIVDYKNIDNIY
ncbi:hypothetical protein M0O54_08360 [Acinetobacter lactucae]|uniref:NfeD-like C-terminal domain-containing protein n=1 Tax=Acinetobacter lactucae TaxID=1785128 RepID=A0AB35K2T6_9GAMM|nr:MULTISPECIES: hypothetical protein [Acinetobacter]MDD9320135.1 hypothetical protein [Acinetobacter lactucae]